MEAPTSSNILENVMGISTNTSPLVSNPTTVKQIVPLALLSRSLFFFKKHFSKKANMTTKKMSKSSKGEPPSKTRHRENSRRSASSRRDFFGVAVEGHASQRRGILLKRGKKRHSIIKEYDDVIIMRPIVDARVDDAPLHNSSRDRFVFNNNGGTTTTTTTTKYHPLDDGVRTMWHRKNRSDWRVRKRARRERECPQKRFSVEYERR